MFKGSNRLLRKFSKNLKKPKKKVEKTLIDTIKEEALIVTVR